MGKQKISISTTDIQCGVTELGKIIQLHSEMSPLVAKGTDAMEKGLTPLLRNNMSSKALTVLRQINSTQSCLISLQSILQEVIDAYEDADVVLKGKVDKIPEAVVDWTKGTEVTVTDEKRNEMEKKAWDDKINKMRQSSEWAEDIYNPFGFMNPEPNHYNGETIYGTQCYAMAIMMQIETKGTQGQQNLYNVSFDDVQIGDVVQYADKSHWVFVIGKEGDNLILGEGNYAYSGKIKWGRTLSKLDAPFFNRIIRV